MPTSSSWTGVGTPEPAIRACKAALAGEIDAETARGIFGQFARRKDILVEDGMMPVAGICRRRSLWVTVMAELL
ncbi:DUF982 domain-containing protein [Mesorhizobium sp. M3A.F.Ca.ET.080.04.2.1]|uniref:DUF982 domain-containing protein n=1 Tax=unclassified Mesorhizobium TaxID=325217 RepID=UPI000F75BD18|nr:DUF982 domain-containing protein [Mesorhizobium sp. M3A.F.Ca.ET.080.04.2.1]RWB66136.1 MAG: DUF982 domain-containing protein [Mesorhizobium sp.]TGS71518.1 DUF982 domain-containing protein [Mesorhizobium sp. M3A.F.Ca.ET.201.01.1.1]TGS82379.1 DUF982 domain-containing protein [Mesorhizobium sp. M3A.F.Ca.ET.175.01.1.1]TGT22201.1 DUF982 domain-containing protein [Mesorhizobium sp. M3A.F.Ca.ET.174.01.1.1]